MTAAIPLTAVDVERLVLPGKQVELIRGRLVVREPPGTWHGQIAANLAIQVGTFVRQRRLGAVFAQDTGFKIASAPDTVRAADLAFVPQADLHLIPRRGYAALAPALAVEVLSPEDSAAEVLAKVQGWIAAGSLLVWVIDPRSAEARIYRRDGSDSLVDAAGALDGEGVLPGFSCRLGDILS